MDKVRKFIFAHTLKKNRITLVAIFLVLSVIIGITLISGSCSTLKDEGVTIYLTKDDIPPQQMDAYRSMKPADQAFIRTSDIISYNEQTHELKLTQDAYDRIYQLEVPTKGTTFLVCINKKTIYWGAFWTPFSSHSFNGVTIYKPLNFSEPYIVTLQLGYPSSDFYDGEDPRNKTEIIEALKKSSKLITLLTISDVDILPKSMKGYELYSWQENDDWHYTVITGTNRNKTIEEISSDEDYISETGWINIHCTGEAAIKAILEKIPSGEFISWNNGSFVSDGFNLMLPPLDIVENIKNLTKALGLNLNVHD